MSYPAQAVRSVDERDTIGERKEAGDKMFSYRSCPHHFDGGFIQPLVQSLASAKDIQQEPFKGLVTAYGIDSDLVCYDIERRHFWNTGLSASASAGKNYGLIVMSSKFAARETSHNWNVLKAYIECHIKSLKDADNEVEEPCDQFHDSGGVHRQGELDELEDKLASIKTGNPYFLFRDFEKERLRSLGMFNSKTMTTGSGEWQEYHQHLKSRWSVVKDGEIG